MTQLDTAPASQNRKPRKSAPSKAASRRGSAVAAAEDVARKHSMTFTLPVVGEVWLGEPKHLPFYLALGVLVAAEVIEWPVAVVVGVGKLLAENAHRETLRDFGEALETEG